MREAPKNDLRNPESLEEIPRQKKQIIVMLGARMGETAGPKGRDFPLWSENQQNSGTSLKGEVSGGASRMRAIENAYRNLGPEEKAVVLVTGGKDASGASKSDEAARQLVERYGMPADTVASLGGAGSTLGNADATMEYVKAHADELGTVHEIKIVTNDYHMLRAWLMFSNGLLKRATGNEVRISPEDLESVKRIFAEELPAGQEWPVSAVSHARERIMTLLAPYFTDSKITVAPLVVEDQLQQGDAASRRYAELLRANEHVRATVEFECKGLVDFLEGKYKKV